jgi:uncharacterized membrane protein YphA (DoxX/SURF4 family)
MNVETVLDSAHARVVRNPLLQRFAELTRIALAVGFIAPGLTKLLGERFTSIGVDSPIGFFFEAMYQTGLYWRFIGAAQILASLLVLVPRTAPLGALVFFPIILNIFVITISMDFRGTPAITGMMLLASLYLLCWEYDRLKPLMPFSGEVRRAPIYRARIGRLERAGYLTATFGGIAAMCVLRGLAPSSPKLVFLGGGLMFVAGFAVAVGAWGHGWWRGRRGAAPTGRESASLSPASRLLEEPR